MEIELSPEVTSVMVYTEQARVTAGGRVHLPIGAHNLIVNDLPLTMDTDSLRVAGKGEARVRIHGVEVRRKHYETTPADEVRALEEKIEQLEDELKALADEGDVLDGQSRFLEGLRSESGQFARGLALGRTKVEEQDRISQFFAKQDQDLRTSKRELETQKRTLNKTLDKARRELKHLSSARPAERNQAMVELEVLSAGEFEVEVTYNVVRATWQPIYDVRLEVAEDGPRLEIEAFAQITQDSGQDWKKVDLKVSTARIDLNRRLPKLKPWYVDIYRPPMPRVAAPRLAQASPAPQAAAKDAPLESAPYLEAEIEAAAVSIDEPSATVTYGISGRGDIPSDGSPHKSMLFRSHLPAEVDYIAVPKHTDAAFRRIKAENGGPSPFLMGTVHLFVGQRFIGVSRLEYVPAGDELELLVGVEERLAIERKMVRREVDKMRLRDRRTIQYGYEIEVRNLMPSSVQIEVHDQVPVARHEEISVKLTSSSPEASERSELNLLEWHLTLAAGAKQTIHYEFQVEYPRSQQVTGLVE